jgi:preprotein translocase subunit SecG
MIIPLLIIHGFVTVAMIGLILLQKSDSSGPLGMGGGSTNSLFTARGVANVLTRSTAFLAVLFVGNCILIGNLITRESTDVAKLINVKASSSSPARSSHTAEGTADSTTDHSEKNEQTNPEPTSESSNPPLLQPGTTPSSPERNSAGE